MPFQLTASSCELEEEGDFTEEVREFEKERRNLMVQALKKLIKKLVREGKDEEEKRKRKLWESIWLCNR